MKTLSKHNKHRLLFIHLALLGSLMLVSSATMAQGGGSTPHVTIGGDVFGGGNLAPVAGKSTVIIDQDSASVRDVYGGGALADVGTSANDSTTVTILQGNISGNVYGGGLGDSTANGYDGNANIAALVRGKVFVNIGAAPVAPNANPTGNATIGGSVFGCNNINGTPLDSVFVNIYKTAHVTANTYPDAPQGGWTATELADNALTQEYALAAVYGGGNKASYKPSVAGRATTVHIYYCQENTIQTAYGGGNAADVGTSSKNANTRLIIDGGRFDLIFGGGNGYSSSGNHNDATQANYNPGANIYGTATTEINAGLYNQIFGGSNQYGTISTVSLNIDKDPDCDEMILESFCGGNEADMVGTDVNTTILCGDIRIGTLYGGSNKADIKKDNLGNGGNVTLTVFGGNYDYVFGGSKGTLPPDNPSPAQLAAASADIEGNVTLNLHGGTIHEAAFGGSDVNGNILGSITVNVLDTVNSCPLAVDTIYGGGRDAAYTPTIASSISPAVNIQHCTVDCVFGAGKGTTATVTANPRVVIGETNTINGPNGQSISTVATVNGDVYGGGDAADVAGTTTVIVQKCNSSAKYVYGGGNAADVTGTQVYIRGGEIDTIFGGGHGNNDPNHLAVANVNGNDTIAITGGKVGKAFAGSNLNGTISGRMSLTVAKSDPATCDLMVGEVYGGGNMATGNAGTITIGCTGTWTTSGANNHTNHNATTNRIGYELEGVGTVYGGANQADIGTSANHSNIVLNIKEGFVENVYGGNNTSGTIYGTIQVNIDSVGTCGANHWYVGNVFGGGNQASYNGTPDVNILHGTVTGSVYGGGNMAGVGGGDVAMSGGTVLTGIYGGCNTSGTVTGDINVNITGGTIGANGSGANVHGGGYGHQTATNGDVDVTINGATAVIWGDVYGGSALGNVNDASSDQTNVTLTSGTIHGDLYGGGLGDNGHAAAVNGAVQVTVNGGTVDGSIYGCNNVNGAPQSTVNVDIYGTDTPASGFALGHVFGGGNRAAYTADIPVVKVHNCTNSIEYVYGGGNAATVKGTDVTIYGGNSIAHVFGGCYGANVTDLGTNVKIYGGTIDTIYGGNNASGSITGDIRVTVNKQAEHTADSCAMVIKEVYGGGNQADSHAGQITIGYTGFSAAEGIQYVYGGANRANVTSAINLTIEEGRVANVFGGNNNSGSISNGITVNIEKKSTARVWDVGNVFGGGNLAATTLTPAVNIINGTVSGSVFGGGNEAGVGGGNVIMTGGAVVGGTTDGGGIYGGCNTSGEVSGDIIINIKGGVVGSQAKLNDSIVTNVFGGGYGAHTSTTGNVTVIIDTMQNITPPVIYGDVYGGSALGSVNDAATDKTTVNVYGGELISDTDIIPIQGTSLSYVAYTGGNIYGGGLGKADYDTCGRVNGEVIVNIGKYSIATVQGVNDTTFFGYATIGGNVYGCNNTNGSPQGNVTVNVYGTAHTSGSSGNSAEEGTGYAIANVFGGGNEASHTILGKTMRVNIKGCENTVGRVFGGGNAAATPSVRTEIQGGRFYQVFGGGNGERGVAYGADINGDLNLFIHGGEVGQFYGASNQNGDISGAINTVVDNNGPCGSMVIDEFFCGGNYADINGDLETDILCSDGMEVHNLYGGCNQANISGHVVLNVYGGIYTNVYAGSKGDLASLGSGHTNKAANIGGYVTLNLYGGTIENAFGGSNINGNIGGAITVNVLDAEGECPLNITNIYGGSNLTSYTPGNAGDPNITSPIVNVGHIKSGIRGDVYGGSKGEPGTTTIVKANPQVNIGYEASIMSSYLPVNPETNAPIVPTTPRAIISGNVFGGGDAAEVQGNTEIFLRGRAKVFRNVYGGGNMGEVTGDTKVIINGANQ